MQADMTRLFAVLRTRLETYSNFRCISIRHLEYELGYSDRINNSNNVIIALNRSMLDERDILVPVDTVLFCFTFVKDVLL